jgi:hypothetical protein
MSLAVAAVVGWILSALLRRALASIDFDRRAQEWSGSDVTVWTGGRKASVIISQLLLWSTLFLGFLVGTAAFDPTLTSQLALRLFGSAINLITALVLLAAGAILGRFLSQSVLITLVNMNVQQARLLSLGVKWLVLIMASAMALNHLSIGGRIVELAFGILFGGIVLALALAVGLHSKDLAEWSLARRDEETGKGDGPPLDHL